MELSRTSLPPFSFSRARILRAPTSLHGKTIFVPAKVSRIPKSCSQYHILPPPKLYNNILLYRSIKYSFPNIAPKISYGRNTIPSIKVNANQNGADKLDSPFAKILEFIDILLRFMKRHVMLGTTVAFISVMTRTWLKNAHLIMLPRRIILLKAVVALFAILCGPGFVSGINQIYDIEIDKINKPHTYPLASGELSLSSAWILAISLVAIGMGISLILQSGWLLAFVLLALLLGLLYSVPPFSTKRSTVGAVLTMGAIGFSSPLIMSGVASELMGLSFQFSTPLMLMTITSTMIYIVAGATKDIEDLEGDKMGNIPTLASIYGPRKVVITCFGSMLVYYAGAISTAMLLPQVFIRSVMIPLHVILASYLIFQTWKLGKTNYTKEASQSFYQSVWKLLTSHFIIFPFI